MKCNNLIIEMSEFIFRDFRKLINERKYISGMYENKSW